MDGKTPVTLLQEYFAKRGCVPVFNLIENGVGSHNPSFTYSVSGFGKYAAAKGTSKKEAKHGAAEKLLSMLMEGGYGDVVDNPYAETLRENSVGALQDFCVTYMIMVPRYEEISATGNPHNRIFVIECSIPPLKTKGEARSKKQAKHMAAYLMLKEVKKLVDNRKLAENKMLDSPGNYKNSNLDKQNRAVERLCEQLLNEVSISNHRKTVELKLEQHFVKLFEKEEFIKSDKWRNLKKDLKENMNDPVAYFTELMCQLSLHWETFPIPSKSVAYEKMISLHIKQMGGATFFGVGPDEDDALKDATLSALNWFSVMGS